MNEIATIEASLAEAKAKAEEAGGTDENLNTAVKTAEEALSKAKAAPSQDPVRQERERIEKKQFTRRERLEFEKRKVDEQLVELDRKEGVVPAANDEPVTVAMLEARDKEKSRETALTLADTIQDEDERAVVKHYLQTRVVPSGNPDEDVKFARAAVNSLRNAQIAEEIARKQGGKSHASGSGAPAKPPEGEFVPTQEELVFMSPPYNLTKEEVLAKRPK